MTKRDALILEYIPFAENIAKKAYRRSSRFFSLDELISAAYYALVKAADNHDPEREFKNYAGVYIKGEIKNYISRGSLYISRENRNKHVSFEVPEISEKYYCDKESIDYDMFLLIKDSLTETQWSIIESHYILGLSISHIAKERNQSYNKIKKVLSLARTRARENIKTN